MNLWFKKSLSFVLAILGIISVLKSELSAQDWIIGTLGSDIDGEAMWDESGTSVSLSSDGTIVAIGAPYNDGNGTDSGHVRVYENQSGSWVQIGSDIDGEAGGDLSSYSVALSSDGKIVAIGAIYSNGDGGLGSGHVRVYEYNTGTSQWIQLGTDIDGEDSSDYSGTSVSLSSDVIELPKLGHVIG